MWSPIVLCFLVGFACALSNGPGWEAGNEYVYSIRGRTLANLKEFSDRQSGFLFRAALRIQPQPNGHLRAQIMNAEYDDIHQHLSGWTESLPEEKISWKSMKFSEKPFETEMKDGRITGLIVSKSTPVWEANMIKSAMSQFQLNIKGDNLIEYRPHTLPKNGDQDNDAVFYAMEDTVTGNTETLYQFRPIPDYIVQADPEEAQYLDAAENGQVIEVLKHKNYSHNVELPSYAYGFSGLQWGQPGANVMGQIMSRECTSRIILTGSLDKFVIRKSVTVNEIYVSPTLSEQKSGQVVSLINATLKEIKSDDQKIQEVPEPVHVGNLVYSYENGFSQSNEVEPKTSYNYQQNEADYDYDYSETRNSIRSPRSLRWQQSKQPKDAYKQDLPELKEAPESPLLPFTTGYESFSIKTKINVVEEVKKLAKKIAERMEEQERDHHEELLDMFSTMISLLRIMDFNEVQEVAKDLYSNTPTGIEHAIWVVFRDAVAEVGTGPCLLVIKEWIQTKKIKSEEASQVVTTMLRTVRQPTTEYMKTMHEFIQQNEVQNQWPLNDTILLGYGDLIRRVYVETDKDQNRFPVNSFQPFRTEEGLQYIRQEVLPYFQKELKTAIQRDETHRIHTLIRTIGNIACYKILPIFEPYLEGKQEVTQFQRVLMVVSLNKLVDFHPQTAQDILYRIYQNIGEKREVRIAAFYQLMRTVPSPDILLVIAQYTKFDIDEYVNAAVKSAIEYASRLEGFEFEKLRKGAQAALYHLNDNTYGPRQGANYLRSYYVEELQKMYKHNMQMFGSDDHEFPRGIQYSLRQTLGGIKRRLFEARVMVSSIDDLLQVASEQTAYYREQEKQQREHSQEQEQNKYASQNIAKLLNLKPEDSEQLEGFLLVEFSNYKNMFAFDNRTMRDLPEIIRKIEEELKNEKEVNYFKLSTREMAVSFPTACGVPFLFTYDIPMLIKAKGKVQATVKPQLVQNDQIQTPEEIELTSDLAVTVSTKVQSRWSVIHAASHQQYFAGFDKHFELNVPVKVQVKFDVKNMNAKVDVELKPRNEHTILHYVTYPYTSIVPITSFEPLSTQQNTKLIKQADLQNYESTFGKETTGMVFYVTLQHKREFVNALRYGRILKQQNIVDAFRSLWDDNTVQYGAFNVIYRPQESLSSKAVLRWSYEQRYRSQPDSDSTSEWILNENAEPSQRQEELMKKVAAQIKNVDVVSVDTSVEFEGEQKIRYIFTGAVASSKVDPKSRVMFTYKRKSNGTPKPQEFHFVAKSYIPNTNALDLEYTLQNEPMASSEIKIKFGNSQDDLAKIEAQLEYRRSNERKQYLKELPAYRQCKEEMKAGNKQLPACLNMTMDANLLDKIDFKIHHENLKSELVDFIQRYFHALQTFTYPHVEIENKDMSLNENEMMIQARFHPDLNALNVTVKTPNQETIFKNIEIDDISQQVFVMHPCFHLRRRLMSQIYEGLHTFIPSCVVDKTYVNTFSNNTYPADISKHWTVMLHYISGNSKQNEQSVQEQLRRQPENYVVLVRENQESANKKDIKVIVSSPETDYKPIEIQMTPQQSSSEAKVRVAVNELEVSISEKESYDVNEGYIQIYALPNGEVKVEVYNAFYIIYDGNRVRVSTAEGKLRNNLIGLCGKFTDQTSDDFMTPQACIARNFEEFIKSLEVEGQKGQEIRTQFEGKSKRCTERDIPLYADVVSSRDYRQKQQVDESNRCTFFKTQYVQQDGKICFTIRAQPTCSSHCQARREIFKYLPVHCVKENSNVAELWKKQIDNGISPDFSGQEVHTSVRITVPVTCSQ